MLQSDSIKCSESVRAALYARVSSQQQVQDDTIASQVHSIEQRIGADGLTIEREMRFIDEGYSGSTLVRPALERLRDMADAGAIDRLYVLSPDRLARNYAYQVVLVDELRRCGVEILFLNHELGRSPEGDMLLQVQGIVAQYERAQIMERSRRGKLHAARRGCVSVLTQAPYGYRYIPKYHSGGDAALNIVLEDAAIVRQMFTWIGTDHISLREIARRLEKQGVLSPTGKTRWGRGTIWNILHNPAYMGQAAYGRRRTGERRKRLRPYRHAAEQPRRPHSQYIVPAEQWIRFSVPAIVDADLFHAVAEQLEHNRQRCGARMNSTPALLAGLTVCGKCGYSLCATKIKCRTTNRISYNYYRCIGRDAYRNGGQAVCGNKAVNAARLNTAVWQDVCDLLDDPGRIADEYTRRLDNGDPQSLANEKQKLIDAANKTRRAITRLIDAFTDGLIEKPEFETRTRSARAHLEQLETQIKSQSELQTGQAEMRLIIGSLETFAMKIKQGLTAADEETKRDIIKAMVKRVEVNDDQIRIVYRINPGPPSQIAARPFLQHCPADA